MQPQVVVPEHSPENFFSQKESPKMLFSWRKNVGIFFQENIIRTWTLPWIVLLEEHEKSEIRFTRKKLTKNFNKLQ